MKSNMVLDHEYAFWFNDDDADAVDSSSLGELICAVIIYLRRSLLGPKEATRSALHRLP
jgi:hypothetical protein